MASKKSRFCPTCGGLFDTSVEQCPKDGSPTYLVDGEEDLVGKSIDGRFTITEMLGAGGMGEVYRARQHSMDRDVAIKVLRRNLITDKMAIQRFHREARAASLLTDPHAITVFDFGQTQDGLLFIVMELLRGVPLSKIINRKSGPMAVERAVGLVIQILEAVSEAHTANVLHRDLKPDNVFLVTRDDPGDFIKVLDFGIAKVIDEKSKGLTSTGMVFGTPTYMSPEQAQGIEMDARGDLYSLGVILFELLAGKPPFTAETPLALMVQKVNNEVPTIFHVNPDVVIPKKLEAVLTSLLAVNPDQRPSSARETKLMLLDAMDITPTGVTRLPDVEIKGGTTRLVALKDGSNGGSAFPTIPRDLHSGAGSETIPPDRRSIWILVAAAIGIVSVIGLGVWAWASFTSPEEVRTVFVSEPATVPSVTDHAEPATAAAKPEEAPMPAPVASTLEEKPDSLSAKAAEAPIESAKQPPEPEREVDVIKPPESEKKPENKIEVTKKNKPAPRLAGRKRKKVAATEGREKKADKGPSKKDAGKKTSDESDPLLDLMK